jgi:YlmC/YmxH family sporulation protein
MLMDLCITTLDALKNKEVINICDGRRLGFVIDGQLDISQGRLISVIVPGECNFLGISKGDNIIIPWNCIERIGDDIILVKVTDMYQRCEKAKRKR